MGIAGILYVNDYDTSKLGLYVEQVDGLDDGADINPKTVAIAGRDGVAIAATKPEAGPRAIAVRGVMKAATNTALRTNIDLLKDRVYAGDVEIRFGQLDRFTLARCRGIKYPAELPQLASKGFPLEIQLLCPDPAFYAVEPTLVGLSSAKALLPLGTRRVRPVIHIMGAVNNPVLTYRDQAGVAKRTMAFTVNLGANDYLEIDCDRGTVTKYAAGVASNGIALLTAGDFITLDPLDAFAELSSWPSLELSGGAGDVQYRRTW
jgi:phage-related protein